MDKRDKREPKPKIEHVTPSLEALPDTEAMKLLFPTEVIAEARRVAREQEKRFTPRG